MYALEPQAGTTAASRQNLKVVGPPARAPSNRRGVMKIVEASVQLALAIVPRVELEARTSFLSDARLLTLENGCGAKKRRHRT